MREHSVNDMMSSAARTRAAIENMEEAHRCLAAGHPDAAAAYLGVALVHAEVARHEVASAEEVLL